MVQHDTDVQSGCWGCRLGLKRASVRVKRAIQFGSRLSRQANVRDFGSNRAANMAKAGGLHLSDVPKGNSRA